MQGKARAVQSNRYPRAIKSSSCKRPLEDSLIWSRERGELKSSRSVRNPADLSFRVNFRSQVGSHFFRTPTMRTEPGFNTEISVSTLERHKYNFTFISTELVIAIRKSCSSLNANETGGLSRPRGKGTGCAATRLIRALRPCRKAAARFVALIVASGVVKTTVISSCPSESLVGGSATAPDSDSRLSVRFRSC